MAAKPRPRGETIDVARVVSVGKNRAPLTLRTCPLIDVREICLDCDADYLLDRMHCIAIPCDIELRYIRPAGSK